MGAKAPQPWSPPTIRPDYKAEPRRTWAEMSRVGRVTYVFAHSLWVVPVVSVITFLACLIAFNILSFVGMMIVQISRWDFSPVPGPWAANMADFLVGLSFVGALLVIFAFCLSWAWWADHYKPEAPWEEELDVPESGFTNLHEAQRAYHREMISGLPDKVLDRLILARMPKTFFCLDESKRTERIDFYRGLIREGLMSINDVGAFEHGRQYFFNELHKQNLISTDEFLDEVMPRRSDGEGGSDGD